MSACGAARRSSQEQIPRNRNFMHGSMKINGPKNRQLNDKMMCHQRWRRNKMSWHQLWLTGRRINFILKKSMAQTLSIDVFVVCYFWDLFRSVFLLSAKCTLTTGLAGKKRPGTHFNRQRWRWLCRSKPTFHFAWMLRAGDFHCVSSSAMEITWKWAYLVYMLSVFKQRSVASPLLFGCH